MRHPLIIFLFSSLVAAGGSSENYALSPETIDHGGLRGSSSNYSTHSSGSPGDAASSTNYSLRSGFAGQLASVSFIDLSLSPGSLAETGSGQLSAELIFTDGTRSPLPAIAVTWSIQQGPLVTISPDGLVTADTVSQDTPAQIRGLNAGRSGELTINVRETIADNFPPYDGDRLSDRWQVDHFGLNNPDGAPTANPDGDVLNNLQEYAFGLDPNSGAITRQLSSFVTIPDRDDFNVIFFRRKNYLSERLIYHLEFSVDLKNWHPSTVAPTVASPGGDFDLVTTPSPLFINGLKPRFYRIGVSYSP
jgi:hypothetical protein